MNTFAGKVAATAARDEKKDGNAPASPAEDNTGKVRVLMNPQAAPVGLSLEVDPVLNEGAPMVQLGLNLGYDYAPPTRRDEGPEPGGEKDEGAVGRLNFHKYQLHTGIMISSGMTRLLGVWRPEGAAEFEKGDVLQAAFIRADIVPVEEVGLKK